MNNGKDRFIHSLRLTKAALKFSGIEIFEKSLKSPIVNLLQFYLKTIALYIGVGGEIIFIIDGLRTGKTLEELSMVTPCAAICGLAIAKFYALYLNKGIVNKVVNKMASIHPDVDEAKGSEDVTEDQNIEDKIVKDSMKFLNRIVWILVISTALVVIVFLGSPVTIMVYDYLNTGSTDLKYPFDSKLFFDLYEPHRWPFVYLVQVVSGYIASLYLFAADSLFYAFCTYLQMHFRLLCHRFENVVSESNVADTRENFKKAAKRHQELIVLVDLIEMLYSKSTLCNIFSSSLLICLSGFNITFISDAGAIFSYVTFLILSLSQIFLLCFFGDMLMTSSTRISEAVYNCKWYDAGPDIRRNVLLVLIRAQKPCKFTAMNFADLNLSAFTTILSRSWSYFALLKTFMDD